MRTTTVGILSWMLVILASGMAHGVTPTPPSLEIQRGPVLQFQSQTNVSYQVLSSSNLRGWEPVGQLIAGTGVLLQVPLETSAAAHRFFRLEATPSTNSSLTDLIATLSLREQSVGAGQVYLPTAVEAVLIASALGADGQRVVVNGTLQPGDGKWIYTPVPSDRLDVVLTNGVLSLHVAALQGDFEQSTLSGFFARAHHVDVTVRQPERGLDLRLESFLSGVTERVVIRGTLPDTNGSVYDIDLEKTGQRDASVEVNSLSYVAQRRWQGTIRGGTLNLTVNTAERYQSLYVTSFVENWTRATADSWTIAGDRWEMNQVNVQIALKDNQVTDFDSYWVAEGNVLRNGQPYARLELGRDAVGYVTVQVRHPGGVEVLERYRP